MKSLKKSTRKVMQYLKDERRYAANRGFSRQAIADHYRMLRDDGVRLTYVPCLLSSGWVRYNLDAIRQLNAQATTGTP